MGSFLGLRLRRVLSRPRGAAAGLMLAVGCARVPPHVDAGPGASLGPSGPVLDAGSRAGADPTLEHIAEATFAKHRDHLAGLAVQVTQRGHVLLAKAYGFADIASQRALRVTDVFRVASITKQFTAAAVLKLAERGALRLDDPLSRHLPDFPGPGRDAPLAQLLSHTSGIVNYTELPWYTLHETDGGSPAELLQSIAREPLAFAAGTRFGYSNSGYYLLGLVIERASGRPYADFLREEILAPAGLTATRYCPDAQDYPDAARGYELAGGELRPAPRVSMALVGAAGALCSSVADLVRWSQALSDGRVVSAASYASMRTPTLLADGSVTAHGFGLGVARYSGATVIGHNGDLRGFVSELTSLPDLGAHIAVLVNTSSFDGLELVPRLAQALIDAAAR